MSDDHYEIIVGDFSDPNWDQPQEKKEAVKGLPIGVESNAAAQVTRTPLIAPKCTQALNQAINKGALLNLPNMFASMAKDTEGQELPTATLVMPFHQNDTAGVLPGQYVTELHLVIHRMPDDKELEESVPVPGE